MSILSIALGLAVMSADAGLTGTAGTPTPALRRYHEIERDMTEALRSEVRAATPEARTIAVRMMCEVYRELVTDPRLETSETLKSYRAKLWSRMTRIQRELEQRQARQAREAPGRAPGTVESPTTESQAMRDAAASLAEQLTLSHYTLGGPGYVLAHSGGARGGAAVQDHGQELIDLIQRTISPDFWDVAGGPGSMFYYRPLMALVVRATSEVHGDVGGLLGALRRAGQ